MKKNPPQQIYWILNILKVDFQFVKTGHCDRSPVDKRQSFGEVGIALFWTVQKISCSH